MQKIIVGLGNPGDKYQKNRHNAGIMLIDYLLEQISPINSKKNKNSTVYFDNKKEIYLVKPNTFMNNSGLAVKEIMMTRKIKLDQLYIAHDDLDLPLGKIKIQKTTGPKQHNGLTSIEEHLQTNNFWRIRIGIDNRPAENRLPGITYTLQNFQSEELEIILQSFKNVQSRLLKQ